MFSKKSYSYWLPFVLFTLHQFSQKIFQIQLPFADHYLDPFCLGALAPHLLCLEQNYFIKKQALNLVELVLLGSFLCFSSEFLLPKISAQFTADVLDCFAIASGILWFLLTSQKSTFRLLYLGESKH